MEENRIEFEIFNDKPESKEKLLKITKETEIWKIKEYIEQELLVEFEIEYGALDFEEVVKMIGKKEIGDKNHIFNLSLKYNKNKKETETVGYYNEFKEIEWDGEKPVVNGEGICFALESN